MAEVDLANLLTPAVIIAAGGGAAAFGRWYARLWADVRRETIVAAATAATRRETFETAAVAAAVVAATRREAFDAAMDAQRRADNTRMIDAIVEQSRSSTLLGAEIAALSEKLDLLVDWRERTPVNGFERVELERVERTIIGDTPSERHRAAPTRRTPAPGYRAPTRGGHDDTE